LCCNVIAISGPIRSRHRHVPDFAAFASCAAVPCAGERVAPKRRCADR
jgi:hypothetical protein